MIGLSKSEQLKKNGTLKEKPLKSKEYLSWLHNSGKTCLVCGSSTIELHHVDNGIGRRDDRSCVCLCPDHHRGEFSVHGFDSVYFYSLFPKERLSEEAQKLFEEWKSENINTN